MKLGVLTTSYPRWPGDPAGNFVGAHVAALRALGHEVDVIAAGDPDDEATRIPSPLFFRGGAPDALEQRPVHTALAALSFSTRFTAAVVARAARWDSIIAHWLVPGALAALPARAPLLAIAHGGDVHTLRRMRLLAPVLHALRARGAELVFVSAELRELARREVPALDRWLAAARVQPMGIDLARFAALTRAPTDPPTIAIAARLVPLKGVDVAIAALDHLKTCIHLVIAGDGPERPRLERRINGARPHFSHGDINGDGPRLRHDAINGDGPHFLDGSSPSVVTFLGAVDTAERDALLASASCVVVPSRVTPSGRTEGTPLIALEALASGVPVVASRVGGLTALAPAARLVAPDDPRALAASIEAVLAAPPSRSELTDAVAHLDWVTVASQLVRST